MLASSKVLATISVSDIQKGKDFYGGILGLELVSDDRGGVTYKSGAGQLFMYQSTTAGTGQATAATWNVADVPAAAAELAAKGVTFEHYDVPEATWDNGVMSMGDTKAAWFKDPDGNILCLAGM